MCIRIGLFWPTCQKRVAYVYTHMYTHWPCCVYTRHCVPTVWRLLCILVGKSVYTHKPSWYTHSGVLGTPHSVGCERIVYTNPGLCV